MDAKMPVGHGRPCRGVLDEVFPMGEPGLREVPPRCRDCPEKVPCLAEALRTAEGIRLQQRTLDRSPATGFIEKIRRWSERKDLHRRLQEKQERG